MLGEPFVAGAVAHEGHRFAAVFSLDGVHLLDNVVVGFVPARFAVLASAVFAPLDTDEWAFEAIWVVGGGDASLAAWAEHPVGFRVPGLAVDLADFAALDGGRDAALPEAHFTIGVNGRHVIFIEPFARRCAERVGEPIGEKLRLGAPPQRHRADCGPRELEKVPTLQLHMPPHS